MLLRILLKLISFKLIFFFFPVSHSPIRSCQQPTKLTGFLNIKYQKKSVKISFLSFLLWFLAYLSVWIKGSHHNLLIRHILFHNILPIESIQRSPSTSSLSSSLLVSLLHCHPRIVFLSILHLRRPKSLAFSWHGLQSESTKFNSFHIIWHLAQPVKFQVVFCLHDPLS